ncbi:hypothetical protein H8B09_14110 [Paenibacillus sp. PR3]|uniref:Uncharacterized protein n=1 Tax=Paenibacillus terricola TaxID=2763503 RepID=A0ABR8MVF9_9BACL|nr:hypothetical protein [Paenibacillus terricola]MBD3919893.1 hypothetical protein [Paenibacillus terricola]
MLIKRLLIAVSICMVLLVVLTIFTYSQFKENQRENQRYERYISAKIAQSLSNLLTAVLISDETLHKVMESGEKEMLPGQATTLCYDFKSIGTEYQELLQTSQSLKKVNYIQTNNITANTAQDIHFFLSRQLIGNGVLGDCTPAKSTITLNEEQFDKIKGIYEISKQWSVIAKNIVPGSTHNGDENVNWDLVVNDKVWVQLIEEYSAYANDSGMTGINQFFN